MYLVISDIHGDFKSLEKVLEFYEKGEFEGIIIAGDILYSSSYFTKVLPRDLMIVDLLNKYSDSIFACMGNNAIAKDMKLFDFNVHLKYGVKEVYGRKLLLTHGHIYDEFRLPVIGDNDICVSGHTHIPKAQKEYGIYMLNPGSISIPRGGFKKTFGLLYRNGFKVLDFEENILSEVIFDAN